MLGNVRLKVVSPVVLVAVTVRTNDVIHVVLGSSLSVKGVLVGDGLFA